MVTANNVVSESGNDNTPFYKWANFLALITIFYNLVEGLVSVFFGLEDETLALFGFGVDSFVEVISGVGIWHMIRRMRRNGNENADRFERTALKITGTSFYILTFGLLIIAAVSISEGYKPETTFWGIIVSVISILTMWLLMHYKIKIGSKFNSQALLADAACTKTCICLSVILLIASVGYEVTGIGMLDSLGALGIAILSFKEGREAFEKSRGNLACSCQGQCH
ncbi:MAG TPA: cation transporter [Thermodesulfovibrionales bacterium]|nr:cation transporter [Thermodesulfovibrionales bacterium]